MVTGKKAFVIDVSICNGCYCCQIACKDEHVGNDWMPYARPQPDTGQFWLKLNEFVRGTVPKVKMHYLPQLCMHCEEAPCIRDCPVEGAIYRREDGLIIIDPAKCTGCKNCLDACPYNAIYFNQDLNIAQKCTGCAHLLDDGWNEPRCVDVCPTGALKFGDKSDFEDISGRAEILKPEAKSKPRVFYLNIPKKFIAGTLYDPAAREVIIAAECTLNSGGKEIKTLTDNYGDFWFEGLDTGTFMLRIESNGKRMQIGPIDTEKDVNLGDIPFSGTA